MAPSVTWGSAVPNACAQGLAACALCAFEAPLGASPAADLPFSQARKLHGQGVRVAAGQVEIHAMTALRQPALTFLLPFVVAAQLPAAPQGAPSRVSVADQGGEPNLNCWRPDVSDDGRFVAFVSGATNLIPVDTNGRWDVFLRDQQLGVTTRVNVDSSGVPADDHGDFPMLSRDGRFVVYSTPASNLVMGDLNGDDDVFVHDTQTATTERVSVDSSGSEAHGASFLPTISASGRYVVFTSSAPDLVAGDTNQKMDVFLRDRVAGTTARVSLRSGGGQSNGNSYDGWITPDGRFVVFHSQSTDLVAGDNNPLEDVFVHEIPTAITTRVSVSTAGLGGNASSFRGTISDDGRFVAFTSYASNLVAGDTNGVLDTFVRDRWTGETRRVSVGAGGVQGSAQSLSGRICGDGRFVAFMSEAANLVSGDTNGVADSFVHELATGLTTRVSVGGAGVQGNGETAFQPWPSISSDGRWVAFSSAASNFVSGDTNGWSDVFLVDRASFAPWSYCTPGTTTNACAAQVSATAQPSVSAANACVLSVANVDGQASGLIFYSVAGALLRPWSPTSSSFLCVKAPTRFSPIQNSGGTAGECNGGFSLDWHAYQAANPGALGNPWSAGDKVFVQAWFRDQPAPKTTSLSNAIELTYAP